jgi:hypothetical protein
MKPERIGKVVKVAPRAGPTAQAQAINEVHITNIVGSTPRADCPAKLGSAAELQGASDAFGVPKAGGDPLGTQELEMVCRDCPAKPGSAAELQVEPPGSIQATAPAELEDLDENPKLRRFRAKQLNDVEYVADCDFLRNIIKVLIQNHSITITPQDIEAIFAVWGDVVVNTRIERFMERDIDVEPKCCGCSKAQQERTIEVIKSILLNGMNVVKTLPDVVKFLGGLGLAI